MSKQDENQDYLDELARNGVDISDQIETEPESDEDPEEETPKAEEPEEETPQDDPEEPESDDSDNEEEDDDDDDQEDPQDDKPVKKRSIYHDLKSRKRELRESQRENSELAARNAELEAEIERLRSQGPSKEDGGAIDELEDYAQRYGADPAAIKELQKILAKGLGANQFDQDILSSLEGFKEWQAQNSRAIDEQRFNTEFESALPELQAMFPGASDKEMKKIKSEINAIAHSDGWNDKEVSYIAFKHQKTLKALVSPKKEGLEKKKVTDKTPNDDDFVFDADADLASMSPAQRAQWETAYQKASATPSGLFKDSDGNMTLA